MIEVVTKPEQVDAMHEADMAAEWERLNADDFSAKLKEASTGVSDAHTAVAGAIDALYDAMKEAEGTPAEDKIASIMNDLENLNCDIGIIARALKEGRCA